MLADLATTPLEVHVGSGPIIAAAIHHGSELRPAIAERIALGPGERLREEDPYTGELAALAPTYFVAHRSRFEVDLNRPRDQAVYRRPEEAWGLSVWNSTLPDSVVDESLAVYDQCYQQIRRVLDELITDHGRVVILDIHSYNHRRESPAACAAVTQNPEVNVGTGSVDRTIWGPLVDRFIEDLQGGPNPAPRLDVRENVKFRGGHFPRWINSTYPERACAIALEFKKTFMDEWTGRLYPDRFDALKKALQSTLPGLRDSLAGIGLSRNP